MSSHHHTPKNPEPGDTIELHATISRAHLAAFKDARDAFDIAAGDDPIKWALVTDDELIGLALRAGVAHYCRLANDVTGY